MNEKQPTAVLYYSCVECNTALFCREPSANILSFTSGWHKTAAQGGVRIGCENSSFTRKGRPPADVDGERRRMHSVPLASSVRGIGACCAHSPFLGSCFEQSSSRHGSHCPGSRGLLE
jgi:hypothetical protein